MTTAKHIFIVTILTTINTCCFGQSIDKTFSGWWARTSWTFEFNNDNTYKRTSNGHFGNTTYDGEYEMIGDTICLVTGSEQITGIQRSKYLLDKDSLLIDLQLYYDYKIVGKDIDIYNSKKRYDILKKPNMDSLIIVSRRQLDTIVQHCISLLTTSRIIEIKDADHIKIIRLINTINLSQDISFKTGIYADFMKRLKDKDYEKQFSHLYDWTPNRGMGFYFQKLQVELGGTPHLFSTYTII
ncbi:hypothetical protein [Pedobacter aquatilis]|uniref:hypothetical protein n=1 Tax=Pedobacter aquatilis TaxID=351343 RepID=UPI00292E1927|nr:hypothetical protein [Pedobacter aquatilis]